MNLPSPTPNASHTGPAWHLTLVINTLHNFIFNSVQDITCIHTDLVFLYLSSSQEWWRSPVLTWSPQFTHFPSSSRFQLVFTRSPLHP